MNALYRTGQVVSVSHDPYRVEVDIGPDEDGRPVVTGPLPVLVPRAGDVRAWSPLTPGERVAVLSPGGEDTVLHALPALVSADYPAPSSAAADEVLAWRAPGGGAEVARLTVERGAAPAASRVVLECGRTRLEMEGTGAVTLRCDAFDVAAPV